MKAIAGGVVVGVALIGGLLFMSSRGGDDMITQTATEQPSAVADSEVIDETSAASADPQASDASPSFTQGEAGYWQVAGVPERLNVRAGPGTNNAVVGSLANAQRHILATGQRADVNGSAWVEVEYDETGATGWVSGRFLQPDAVPADDVGTTSQSSSGSSRVCFSSSSEPPQVARIDFSDHIDISGVRVTSSSTTTVTEQVSGTLDDGQAVVTLVDASGQAVTETWTFGPASIRSSGAPQLAVVECATIADLLG